ncbi:MAG: hypothetical protein ABJ004_09385 [Cyclobacteriaceae bacterium]
MKSLAQEKQAYYKVQMDLSDWQGALSSLSWLYINVPTLHQSIYQDGAKNIEHILETDISKKRREALEDSLLWMYDQRILQFNDASAVDRKAYAAFKLYYKNSKQYPLLSKLYDTLFSLPAQDISTFNLTPYMTLGVYYYKTSPEELTDVMLVDIYDRISGVIDEKIRTGGDEQKLKKEQNKVDALFGTSDPLTCDFIKERMVPKFRENPEDIDIIKKIFTYSLRVKCMDQPYFIEVAEKLYEAEPTLKLAKVIGDRYSTADTHVKAIEYYKFAESLSENQDEKFELLYKQAQVYSRMGKKQEARKKAIEALEVKEDPKPINLIGHLYMSSFEECKKGESRVMDRSVFLAAYEMYKRSDNAEMMAKAKEQFPSIEEIFNENYTEGQVITVPCWIQMTVKIQRR